MKYLLQNKNILPFYFEPFGDEYLLTNIFREHLFLTQNQLMDFISDNVIDQGLLKQLQDKKFVYRGESEIVTSELSKQYKNQNLYLFEPTSLHIFVVTENCNLECVYCQVGSNKKTTKNTNMSFDVARKSVDIAMSSPSRFLAFEFQGGEPLLNFKVIKEIVKYSNEIKGDKIIEFRLVSNLTAMSSEILDFIILNKISISVSLDGDQLLHDKNRPMKGGKGSFAITYKWIKIIKEQTEIQISGLPTITKNSLDEIDKLLSTYVDLGFHNIFIRNLSPFGTAVDNWGKIGYSAEEFVLFYETIFNKILEINKRGVLIVENYASMILSKILNKSSINFMDLRSPCGAGVGQMAYNWDGDIYTCDEGRMLSVEGDHTFRLGNVFNDNYKSCLCSDNLQCVLSASVLDSLVSCKDCVYSPICGVCPAYNYKTYKRLFINMSLDYRCKVFKGIYKVIYTKLKEDDPEVINIFKKWIK